MEEDPLAAASRLKEQGNGSFRDKLYPEAIALYSQAINLLNPETEGHKESLAVLYGNVAACHQNQEDLEDALQYCDKSLAMNPHYTRVRGRKVRILLDLGNVREAKEEADKGEIPREIKAEVDHKAADHFEEEKEEMIGKLKDMGNSILGKFGLSIDNFKTQKNENGSYNISFSK